MNKKGFAISIILYAVVFIIITIFYLLLGIMKSRYSVNNDLRNNIFNNLNSYEHIFTKLDKDDPVSVLTVNPDGGSVEINGTLTNSITSIINYVGETVTISNANKDDFINHGELKVTYNSNGGDTNPDAVTIGTTNTKKYQFDGWNSTGSCGSMIEDTYTFPSGYGSECMKKAIWIESENVSLNNEIVLAPAPTRGGYYFLGWRSSIDNQIYKAGSDYTVTNNTTMTGEWMEDIWATNVSYELFINGVNCENVQCVLDNLTKIVSDTGKLRKIVAAELKYNNSKTHLSCENVQCALDEISKNIEGVD